MTRWPAGRSPSEERLRGVPWRALRGLAPALDAPLAAVLRGEEAERVLDRFLRAHRGLDRDGRAAVKEAIYGVAVWRRRLAWHIGAATSTSTSTSTSTAAAVSTAAAADSPRPLLAALLRDLGGEDDAERVAGLAPGTLPPPRPPPGDPAIRFSLPDWLLALLRREAGDEAELLADALDRPGPMALRPDAARIAPAALAARLAAEGVATRPGELVPAALVVTSSRANVYGLPSYRDGLFEVQDEASQLAGCWVGARPGESVLDLCAGAGGKTLQLAAAVGPGGAVHACDPDAARLERLRVRARRAGVDGIVRVHGAAPPPGLRVDRALVDAPCSELGALRRGPDARFRVEPGSFAAWPPIQLALLRQAAAHLHPGGRLVYATCTLRREENEEVAEALGAGDGLRPAGARRTWPHREGADGFFLAAWERRPARRGE